MFWRKWRRKEPVAPSGDPPRQPQTAPKKSEIRKPPEKQTPPPEELRFLKALLAGEEPRAAKALDLSTTRIRSLPDLLEIGGDLILRQCQRLRSVGETSLVVSGNLSIGGMNGGPAPWIAEVKRASKPVRNFLSKLSGDRSCPIKTLPASMRVGGDLRLQHCHALRELPRELTLGGNLELGSCTSLHRLPENFHVKGDLRLVGLRSMTRLPAGLRVDGNLAIDGLPITELPPDLDIKGNIWISNCANLRSLPPDLDVRDGLTLRACGIDRLPPEFRIAGDLSVISCPLQEIAIDVLIGGDLSVRKCPNFESLGGREFYPGSLDLVSCPALTTLPPQMKITNGLLIDTCPNLERLPALLVVEAKQLRQRQRWRRTSVELINCPKVTALPESLQVEGSIDIGGTQITAAEPSQFEGNQFAWRGFQISGRALFQPESIDPKEIFRERNAEIRRLMAERYGIGKLFENLRHRVLDKDVDPGGERRLINLTRVRPFGQDVRLLDCRCPSTARRYLLEVPQTVETCHAAAAWLAGFDNPDDYHPQKET